jgi:pyrroloquinoline quinone biosynthesis protein D
VIGLDSKPRLAAAARLRFDRVGDRMMLLYPERGIVLNGTALAILELCTGEHRVRELIDRLLRTHAATRAEVERDVLAFLRELERRRLLVAPAVKVAS